MEKSKATQQRGERWWQRLIEKQARTGERVVELCARHGVTPRAFYYWRRRGAVVQANRGFTELEVGLVNECEIRCRNGRSVVVRGAVSPAVLANILMAAEEVGQ
jgi:hypothetical protein